MNQIEAYTKAHSAKRISKRIQQLSYSLNKLELRFDIEDLEVEDLVKLITAYNEIFNELKELTNEINEYEQRTTKQ